ncbi:hypothetical protein ACI77O_12210 [Pseudomonas tritici]|uniref:hypothetical protein n=1 Tax=Pseudomonas tritici TaxID=2745518 RepID=UPI00387B10AB
MANNLGNARCDHCGSEYRLFTIFNRDMQGLCKGWRKRHERGCASKTPAQRRAWAKKYAGLDSYESSITVDLDHPGFREIQLGNEPMNDSTTPNGSKSFPPELIAKLGIIPDAVMADLVKALRLDGKVFAMLDPGELEVFNFFRNQGRKYGVEASIVSPADVAELATAKSQEHQDETNRQVNSTVRVVVID